MKCSECPYSEEEKSCPCIHKTIADIKRIGEKKELKRKKHEDYYFKLAIARSKRLANK